MAKFIDYPDLPSRSFRVIAGRLATLEGGKDSGPPPPDYTAAANATAAGNAEAARIAAMANRVNQYGPGGSIVYSQVPGSFDEAGYNAALQRYNAAGGANQQQYSGSTAGTPADGFGKGGTPPSPQLNPNYVAAPTREQFTTEANPDRWSVTTTLSPAQQAIYNNKTNIDTQLGGLALTGLNKAQTLLSNPELDLSGVTPRTTNAGQLTQDAMIQRLQPQIDRQREMLRTQLLNQGLNIGTDAYSNAFQDQNKRENDLYLGATAQGLGLDTANRQQGIQEQAYLQDRPLSLINALRSGTQVQGPQFQNVPQQATTAGPNYSQAASDLFGAQTAGYNANVAQQNATQGGLFNLAGALGSAGIQAKYGS